MDNKSIDKKTNSPKKRATSKMIAEVAGCATCTVNQVLRGVRNEYTTKGERITVAQMLLEEGIEQVIINAKKAISQ